MKGGKIKNPKRRKILPFPLFFFPTSHTLNEMEEGLGASIPSLRPTEVVPLPMWAKGSQEMNRPAYWQDCEYSWDWVVFGTLDAAFCLLTLHTTDVKRPINVSAFSSNRLEPFASQSGRSLMMAFVNILRTSTSVCFPRKSKRRW